MKLVQASNDPDKILTTPTKPIEILPPIDKTGPRIDPRAKDIGLKLRTGIRMNVDKQGNPNLVGLAANQIGINASMCVCLIGHEDGDYRWITMVNPKIEIPRFEYEKMIEGCGSLREPEELYYEVERPVYIYVQYFNEQGEKMGIRLDHFSARVVQHEVDHLNGILISDRGVKVDRPSEE